MRPCGRRGRAGAISFSRSPCRVQHVGRGIFELRRRQRSRPPSRTTAAAWKYRPPAVPSGCPSGRGDPCRCASAARRSWCRTPACQVTPKVWSTARRCRSGRSGRSSGGTGSLSMATRFGALVRRRQILMTSAVPSPRRKLDDAEPIARRNQRQASRVDRRSRRCSGGIGCGNVALMKPYCIRHRKSHVMKRKWRRLYRMSGPAEGVLCGPPRVLNPLRTPRIHRAAAALHTFSALSMILASSG